MICFKPKVTNTSRRWPLKSLGTERTRGTLSFPGTRGLFSVVPGLCVGKGVGLEAVYGFGPQSLEKPSSHISSPSVPRDVTLARPGVCACAHHTHGLSFPLIEHGWGGHKTGKEAKVTVEQNLVSCRRAVCFGEARAGAARACSTYTEYILWGQGHDSV